MVADRELLVQPFNLVGNESGLAHNHKSGCLQMGSDMVRVGFSPELRTKRGMARLSGIWFAQNSPVEEDMQGMG